MILLKNLTINNFLSHTKTEIKFQPNQKLLIAGKSGAGKSGIIDAIVWCLYNNGRVDNRSLIKKGKKIAKVTLDMVDNEITYRIERSVTDRGKNELNVYEKEGDKNFKPIKVTGLRGTQEYLEKEVLHSSYILFVNSIIYPQSSSESFVQQTSSRRKDIMLEIINAAKYDEYLKSTKEKLGEFETQLSNNESIISTINQSLSEDKLLAQELPSLQTQEQSKKIEIETNSNLLKSLTTQLAEINLKIKTKDDKGKELDATKETIQMIEIEIKSFLDKIKELEETDTAKMMAEIADLDTLKNELQSLHSAGIVANEWNVKMLEIIKEKPLARNFDNEIDEINKQLIELLKRPDEKCPNCGFKLPNVYKDENLKRLQGELTRRNQEKVEYAQKESVYLDKLQKLGEQPKTHRDRITELENLIYAKEKRREYINNFINTKELNEKVYKEKLGSKEEEKKNEENEISRLANEITILGEEIKGGEAVKKEEEELISRKIRDESSYNILIGKLSVAEEASKKVVVNEDKIKKLNEENEKLGENIELMELLKTMFSPNGLKAIIVDYTIPELESRINEILEKLSNFRVKLNTQKISVDGEKVIEGLWITIINDQGDELDFLNFSGGEKMRISLAIQEGLSTLQKFGFRIMDEVIVGLDQNTIEDFGTVMIKLKEDISQILVISHISEIKDLFTEKINVTKINGTSQVTLDN